jgi:hypothetical protein
MNHLLLTCLTILIVGTAAAALPETSVTSSAVCSLSHGQAFEAIKEAHGMINEEAAYEPEGSTIRNLLEAFQCVLESPEARQDLARLLEDGNTAGQLYA